MITYLFLASFAMVRDSSKLKVIVQKMFYKRYCTKNTSFSRYCPNGRALGSPVHSDCIDESTALMELTRSNRSNRRAYESIEWTTRRIDESIQTTNRWNRQIDESMDTSEAHLNIYCQDARQNPEIIRAYLSVSIL